MLSNILFLFALGCVHGQATVPWWNLPFFYVNGPISSPDVGMALYFATLLDPIAQGLNYTTVAEQCYLKPLSPGSPLTIHEAAAVSCYTLDTKIVPATSYALRSFRTDRLTTWTPFFKFFHSGVSKLNQETRPGLLCRGDGFDYTVPPVQSVVTLPLSWSSSSDVCQLFAGDPSKNPCTIIQLKDYVSEKSIIKYSFFEGEEEYIMLPGTLASVSSIVPQTKTSCRIVYVYEINPALIPQTTNVTSLIPPRDFYFTTEQLEHSTKLHSESGFAPVPANIRNMNQMYAKNN